MAGPNDTFLVTEANLLQNLDAGGCDFKAMGMNSFGTEMGTSVQQGFVPSGPGGM